MEKFIPYEKLSKKKQRELNAARRGTWTINPVTRKPANPKAYNRKTARKWKDDSHSVPFVLFLRRCKQRERIIPYSDHSPQYGESKRGLIQKGLI